MMQRRRLVLSMCTASPLMVCCLLERMKPATHVGLATKEAIVRIVQTFGPRLTAFRFPHHIAEKLQGFADCY
jgi:hypothetical protein